MDMMNALLLLLAAGADEFHVSPTGNDALDGRSPLAAWRSVAKVNATSFRPGDRVLFARGGEWHESLRASSSGASGTPVVYDAYGKGPKPRFWGSDVLSARDFKPAGDGRYTLPVPVRVGAVLVDHVFLPRAAWTWAEGILSVVSHDRDPRRGGLWTACVRVDLVHSNGKNHLVFRNLVADESADERDGYGFRVMGSDDVLLEDCEAYRAGRHHFGTINSSNFTGRRLIAATAMPDCPGGCTFFVSFSDASRKNDAHRWIDCAAERLENPGHGNYQVFYNHGEGLGPILLENLVSRGGQFTAASSDACRLTIRGGRLEDNSLVIYGSQARVEGLTITGNGAIDLFCSDTVLENVFADLSPKGGGPTGYGAGLVLRDAAARNLLRFSTIRMTSGAGIVLAGRGAALRLEASAVVSGEPVRGEGFQDGAANLLSGDLKLGATGAPAKDSPLVGAAQGVAAPATDAAGRPRPKGRAASGAFEPR